ncbi:MAG: TrkH family potassium uptake protein, partial [Armatimonadetes bacterium]|nr:TrkH family potassium uptake protein [Armatimonadota bacterium]
MSEDISRRVGLRLRARYRVVLAHVGTLLLICGGLMLTPLLVLVAWPEEVRDVPSFLFPAAGVIALGSALWLAFRGRERISLSVQEGSVIVVTGWLAACVVSALPLMLCENISFTRAVFEAVSGWTTTGLSVVDVQQAGRMTLLWRSIMQLAGGAGLAIIMLASITGPGGTGLSAAEGRTEQLVPNVRASVRLVLRLYLAYAVIGTLLFRAVGLSLFEAVNHSFAAVSTGGFSTRLQSIGAWDRVAVDLVTIPLMLLGGMNFLTAWDLARGRVRALVRSGEVRLALVLLAAGAVFIYGVYCRGAGLAADKAVRVAVFEPVAALTTTGFTSTDYTLWSGAALLALMTLMIIGGAVNSTAGGIKQYRVYLLLRSVVWDMRRAFLPRTTVHEPYVWHGDRKHYFGPEHIRRAGTFAFIYMALFALGATIIAAHGYSMRQAMFEFASALSTVGLSVGVTGAGASPAVLWTIIAGMLLGRLEF